MARKKKLTLKEEIVSLEQEFTKCEEEIVKLTDKKIALEKIIEQKQMEALYQALLKSGKSIEEIIDLISEKNV